MNNGKWGIFLFILLAGFLVSGCEATRVILGTSTRALREARVDALDETFSCGYYECYEAVLEMAAREADVDIEPVAEGALPDERMGPDENSNGMVDRREDSGAKAEVGASPFDVFMKNRVEGYIIVMGVPGNINTTEVGIFFTRITPGVTRVEVSSLSSSAKRTVAEALFTEFEERFGMEQ